MSLSLALVAVLAVALAAGWLGFSRARRLRAATRLHSLPVYHGAYAGLWAAIPALLLLAAWAPMQSRLVEQSVLSSPEGRALPAFDMQRQAILAEGRAIAHGERDQGFNSQSAAIAPRIRSAEQKYAMLGGLVAIIAAIAAGAARRVGDADEMWTVAAQLLADPAARERMCANARSFIAAHRGATDRLWAWLAPRIEQAPRRR